MNDPLVVKVSSLLPPELDGMEAALKGTSAERGTEGLPVYVWESIRGEATAAIHAALGADLYDLLGEAWATARELHRYKDPAQHPPGETATVFLGEHDLTVESHPTLAITVGPAPLRPIRLTFAVAAHVRAVSLSLRAGHLCAVSGGDLVVSAALSYNRIPLHQPIASRALHLPGRHVFAAPGIRLL